MHGSAPDIAGKGLANPVAAVLSAAMMAGVLGRGPTPPPVIRAACDVVDDDGRHHRPSATAWSSPSARGADPCPSPESDKIWMNGELVPWDEARVHVLTHTLHYGNGVFEGIRAYETAEGPAVFRLTPHIERLFASAKILMLDIPYSRCRT